MAKTVRDPTAICVRPASSCCGIHMYVCHTADEWDGTSKPKNKRAKRGRKVRCTIHACVYVHTTCCVCVKRNIEHARTHHHVGDEPRPAGPVPQRVHLLLGRHLWFLWLCGIWQRRDWHGVDRSVGRSRPEMEAHR